MYTATDEQISAWKEKYDQVFKLSVDGKVAYLHSPDRKTLSYASSIGAKDPIKFNEILLKQCWIDGDKEIQTNDSLFMSVSGQMAELLNFKESALEKL